ncbi:MAG: zinc ribbon domain-containing protein [Ignavibacteria bacterium]|nr:zinc ribbon domain-containing protein [Ignavibacteria bacterium]
MTCEECGHENKEDSQFCANCGAKLDKSMEGRQPGMCTACNFKNKPDSMFCGGCGARQQSHHHEHRRKHEHHLKQLKGKARGDERKSGFRPLTVGLFIVGGVILLVLALDSKTGIQEQERPIPVVESKSNDPALETKVLDVASKFICSCGTCGEQSLDVCSCNTAVEERQYIRASLQSGQSVDQVAVAVGDKFGWVKPEFSAKIDSLARKSGRRINATAGSGVTKPGELRIPDKKEIGFSEFPLSQSGATKIATAADRDVIFSKFKCPCGQCGVDELKECGCSHPRGATEVKSFVDEKIAEKKHTIAQVIKEVENKYGGRTF